MACPNDGERALPHSTTERTKRATPMPVEPAPMPVEPATLHHTRRFFPTWPPPRRFVAAVIAIGGMQLMAVMDGPVAVFALPRIQKELGLSDAGPLLAPLLARTPSGQPASFVHGPVWLLSTVAEMERSIGSQILRWAKFFLL